MYTAHREISDTQVEREMPSLSLALPGVENERKTESMREKLLGRERSPEHEHGVSNRLPEQPAVHVPQNLHRNPVNEDGLVPPKLPRQPLHLHHSLPVDQNLQRRVFQTYCLALDHDLVNLPAVGELRLRGVHLLPEQMLFLGDAHRRRSGPHRVSLLVRLSGHVSQQEKHFSPGDHRDEESLRGLRRNAEFRSGEVPENVDLRLSGLGALGAFSLGEEPRADVDLAEVWVPWIVEGDAEALTHEIFAPGDGGGDRSSGQVGFVDAGDQILAVLPRRGRRVRDLYSVFPEAGREIPHFDERLSIDPSRRSGQIFCFHESRFIRERALLSLDFAVTLSPLFKIERGRRVSSSYGGDGNDGALSFSLYSILSLSLSTCNILYLSVPET